MQPSEHEDVRTGQAPTRVRREDGTQVGFRREFISRPTNGSSHATMFSPSHIRRLELRREDWSPYAFWDPDKLYTRNLVATDGKTFTLLLLCWNPGKVGLVSFSTYLTCFLPFPLLPSGAWIYMPWSFYDSRPSVLSSLLFSRFLSRNLPSTTILVTVAGSNARRARSRRPSTRWTEAGAWWRRRRSTSTRGSSRTSKVRRQGLEERGRED